MSNIKKSAEELIGNTAIALAAIARKRGYKFIALLSEPLPTEKQNILVDYPKYQEG